MGMKEDWEGRVVIDCTTLLPDSAAFPAEVVKIGEESVEEPREVVKEEKKEEALVAALDVKVLHGRVRHLGKVGMERIPWPCTQPHCYLVPPYLAAYYPSS